MTHLLQIDSSPRGDRSHSHRMTREFVEQWQTDITFIHVENDEYGGQKLADSIANARAKIIELVVAA